MKSAKENWKCVVPRCEAAQYRNVTIKVTGVAVDGSGRIFNAFKAVIGLCRDHHDLLMAGVECEHCANYNTDADMCESCVNMAPPIRCLYYEPR